jgi:uncharacterized protein YllA (UPF0747 family)
MTEIDNSDYDKLKKDLGVGDPNKNAELSKWIRAEANRLADKASEMYDDAENTIKRLIEEVDAAYENVEKEERAKYILRVMLRYNIYGDVGETIVHEINKHYGTTFEFDWRLAKKLG